MIFKILHELVDKLIFFFHLADKKKLGAEKDSKYYQKYGNPRYGGELVIMIGLAKLFYYNGLIATLYSI